MGNLSIVREPLQPDFIGNNPFIEFQLSGHETMQSIHTGATFFYGNFPHWQNNGEIHFTFLNYNVIFLVISPTDPRTNDHNTLVWQADAYGWQAEFDRKIKMQHLIAKFYDVSIIVKDFQLLGQLFYTLSIQFNSRQSIPDSGVSVSVLGSLVPDIPPIPILLDKSFFHLPTDWQLWVKFSLIYNGISR